MKGINTNSLMAASCNNELIERLERQAEKGNSEACLQLLRAHRCDLVEAMHEAQKPIDVCDWIIQEVEASHA